MHFVKTFCSDAPNKTKIEALRKACQSHVGLTKECSKGLGQDRLLYAMQCLALRDEDGADASDGSDSDEAGAGRANGNASSSGGGLKKTLPGFYTDPGWSLLNHTTLSTSNCGNPCLRFFGFGPVVSNGIGIGA